MLQRIADGIIGNHAITLPCDNIIFVLGIDKRFILGK